MASPDYVQRSTDDPELERLQELGKALQAEGAGGYIEVRRDNSELSRRTSIQLSDLQLFAS